MGTTVRRDTADVGLGWGHESDPGAQLRWSRGPRGGVAGRSGAGARRAPRPGGAVRASTTPTPIRSRTPTSAGPSCPFVPGSEVVGTVVDPGGLQRRVCGFVRPWRRLRRARGRAARRMVFDVPPTASPTPQALSLLVQGLTAHHLVRTSREGAARRVRRRPRRGRRRRQPRDPDRQAGGRRTRHRDGVDPGEARPRARPRRRRGRRARQRRSTPTTSRTCWSTRTAGARSTSCCEMVGGPTFDGSLGALAPFGRLVTFGMASRRQPHADPARQPHGRLALGHRLLARRLHAPAPRRHHGRRPARRARGAGRRRPAAAHRGSHLPPVAAPGTRTRTCAPARRPARSCSTRDWTEHTRDRERRPRVPGTPPRRLRRRRARRAPRELGASHADLRVVALRTSMTERCATRGSTASILDYGLRARRPRGRRRLLGLRGLGRRSVRTPRATSPSAPSRWRASRAPLTTARVELAPRAGARRHLGVGVRHRPVRGARGRAGRALLAARSSAPARPRRGDATSTRRCMR